MWDVIFCFVIATVISFVGSLQLGPVNLNVIQVALNKNLKASIYVAIGGSIPEIIYSTIAFIGAEYFIHHTTLITYLQIASIFIFLLFGIIAFTKKENKQLPIKSTTFSFASGFMLGLLNPMLITFWLGIIIYLERFNHSLSTSLYSQIAFIIGTSVGAFLLLISFAVIVTKHKLSFISNHQNKINKLIGIIFIILAVIQFAKLIT